MNKIKRAGRKLVQRIKRLRWIKCCKCKFWEVSLYYPALGICCHDPHKSNMYVHTQDNYSCADGIRKLDLTRLQLAWADCQLYGLRLLKLLVWLCRVCGLSLAAVGVMGLLSFGAAVVYHASPWAAAFLFGVFLYIFVKGEKLC